MSIFALVEHTNYPLFSGHEERERQDQRSQVHRIYRINNPHALYHAGKGKARCRPSISFLAAHICVPFFCPDGPGGFGLVSSEDGRYQPQTLTLLYPWPHII